MNVKIKYIIFPFHKKIYIFKFSYRELKHCRLFLCLIINPPFLFSLCNKAVRSLSLSSSSFVLSSHPKINLDRLCFSIFFLLLGFDFVISGTYHSELRRISVEADCSKVGSFMYRSLISFCLF